jgi:hypothetical protein
MSQVSLTLRRRLLALTLPNRNIKGGASVATAATNAIMQGFEYAGTFDTTIFLTYGIGGVTTAAADAPLTLRRRKIALTLGG